MLLGWSTASPLQRHDPPVGQAIRGWIKQFKESGYGGEAQSTSTTMHVRKEH
jgi:hypothetical protein